MNEDENRALTQWHEDIEARAQGGKHAINRGISRSRNGKAPGMWRCEDRDQAADQMDIWSCITAAEQDDEETFTGGEL